MKIIETNFEKLVVIKLDRYADERGYFEERFHREKFRVLGLPPHFAQTNHTCSWPGVLRGLHYQFPFPQGKLVSILEGEVWDVALDLRKNSKTFGKFFSKILSAKDAELLWVPPGFAHGFCVMGERPAHFLYQTDDFYHPETESGILWSDPELAISWPVDRPLVSKKDSSLPSFSHYAHAPVF